jgi:hypothetical protein
MTEQSQLPRIFVDFNNSDRQGRVRLNCVGTVEDRNRLGIVLQDGTELLFCCLELETEGSVTYSTDSTEEGLWLAGVDWNNIRELPGNK